MAVWQVVHHATGDSSLFNGKAMTYYGRWTYKYEEAARQGAAGVIIIHEACAAAYPWAVVQNSWKGAKFDLVSPDGNASKCKFEGWATTGKAKKIFQLILEWLKLLPGINRFFLEQEAKIKTDRIIHLNQK